jgi:transcriptional regulator with XRE-family HTH domain
MSPLRCKRLATGLSMMEVARRAHMDPTKLSRLERGLQQLRQADILILADILGCSADHLLRLPQKRTTPNARAGAPALSPSANTEVRHPCQAPQTPDPPN